MGLGGRRIISLEKKKRGKIRVRGSAIDRVQHKCSPNEKREMRYILRSWFGLESTTDGLLETLLSQLQGEPGERAHD